MQKWHSEWYGRMSGKKIPITDLSNLCDTNVDRHKSGALKFDFNSSYSTLVAMFSCCFVAWLFYSNSKFVDQCCEDLWDNFLHKIFYKTKFFGNGQKILIENEFYKFFFQLLFYIECFVSYEYENKDLKEIFGLKYVFHV